MIGPRHQDAINNVLTAAEPQIPAVLRQVRSVSGLFVVSILAVDR